MYMPRTQAAGCTRFEHRETALLPGWLPEWTGVKFKSHGDRRPIRHIVKLPRGGVLGAIFPILECFRAV